jgi:hypothetical protein
MHYCFRSAYVRFSLFAVILAWTDYSTTTWQKKQTTELPSEPSKKAA